MQVEGLATRAELLDLAVLMAEAEQLPQDVLILGVVDLEE